MLWIDGLFCGALEIPGLTGGCLVMFLRVLNVGSKFSARRGMSFFMWMVCCSDFSDFCINILLE